MSLESAEVTAVALHSFLPTQSDELNLVEGDKVLVLQQQEDEWWLVKKGDLVGLIPSTHVSIISVTNTALTNLPSGWDSCVDEESGEKFYFNEVTGLTHIIIEIKRIRNWMKSMRC
jgi:SH3 domain/WW domain